MNMPGCRFVLVSREAAVGDGTPLPIAGLGPADGLTLVEQELGRELTPSERAPARAVCDSLHGHPFKIRQAAAGVRDGQRTFDVLARELGSGEAGPALAQLVLGSLTEEELAIVQQLAALRGETLGAEPTVALLERSTVAGQLGDLQRRRVIASASPRHRIAGALSELTEEAPASGDGPSGWPASLGPERARAVAYFTSWAQANRAEPARVLTEAPALLELLRHARSHGGAPELIGLGRATDGAFAWGRRWETWGALLTTILDAAVTSGDRGAQGWAKHQLGTRAYCRLGGVAGGIGLLKEALEIREQLGDEAGAAATRHNLEFIACPPGGDGDDGIDDGGGGPQRLLATLGAVVATLALVAVVALGSGGGDDSADESGSVTSGGGNARDEARLAVDVSGAGTVSSRPAGIDCPGTCEQAFPRGIA